MGKSRAGYLSNIKNIDNETHFTWYIIRSVFGDMFSEASKRVSRVAPEDAADAGG